MRAVYLSLLLPEKSVRGISYCAALKVMVQFTRRSVPIGRAGVGACELYPHNGATQHRVCFINDAPVFVRRITSDHSTMHADTPLFNSTR